MTCRRDYRDLNSAERARFVTALYDVKARGVVDQFADLHRDHFDHGHRNSSFLPWHREFLRLFERELQVYDPRVTIPYWNSSTDQATGSGLWSASFLGQFDSAWGLGRSLGSGGSLPSPAAVDTALGHATYDQFWPDLENNVHNGPHPWVGGFMAGASSPHDPVFYLHHCFIDMCWAQWQLRNPEAPFVPSPGAPDITGALHPWATTVGDVLDHRTINVYDYPVPWVQDAPRVTPPPTAPPTITFDSVPAGLTFLRAAIFETDSCDPLTFTVADPVVDAGPAGSVFTRLGPAAQVLDPRTDETARIWFAYTGTAAGDTATGHVDIDCVETGQSWQVPITADVIPLPRAAIALILDQSNSMTFGSGIAPGVTRGDVLRFSAPPAVEVLDDDHAMLITSFDHDAHPLIGLTKATAAGRLQLKGVLADYAPNPNGWTSIGEALQSAHDQLTPVTGYDIKATVVLTDGQEDHGPHTRRSITDVAPLITERCYAIGLGTPSQINPAALMALCQGRNGYMLITGELNQDAFFRLAKYYQQIIAGATNQEIVLDPEGILTPGQINRIPFQITETDILARAVLLTNQPRGVLFGLETPEGKIIDSGTLPATVELRTGPAVDMYRTVLPLPIDGTQAHAGQWHALAALGGRQAMTHGDFAAAFAAARYSLNIQAISNLRMRASLTQSGNEPGATLFLQAALTEYGIPLPAPATIRAELEHPDGRQETLTLTHVGEATHQTSLTMAQEGVYHFRIVAEGSTTRGRPFTREQLLTGAVWADGDRPPPSPNEPADHACEILECLAAQPGVRRLLDRWEIDLTDLDKCLCRESKTRTDPH